LLGNDRETKNETMAVAGQHILNKLRLNYNKEERCFLSGPCQDVILRAVGAISSAVGYSPDGKDVSRGHCQDPLPGND
jgi:hypothetical protein